MTTKCDSCISTLSSLDTTKAEVWILRSCICSLTWKVAMIPLENELYVVFISYHMNNWQIKNAVIAECRIRVMLNSKDERLTNTSKGFESSPFENCISQVLLWIYIIQKIVWWENVLTNWQRLFWERCWFIGWSIKSEEEDVRNLMCHILFFCTKWRTMTYIPDACIVLIHNYVGKKGWSCIMVSRVACFSSVRYIKDVSVVWYKTLYCDAVV